MANATLPRLDRSQRAAGIITRQECIPCEDHPGFFHVTDTETGSGTTYIAAAHRCTCPDYIYRGQRCKHSIAAAAEEAALAQFCAEWDAQAEQQRQTVVRDRVQAGPISSQGLRCHTCQGPAESLMCHLGGHGMVTWALCVTDSNHPARRLA